MRRAPVAFMEEKEWQPPDSSPCTTTKAKRYNLKQTARAI